MTRLVVTFALLLAATVAAQSPSGEPTLTGLVTSTDGVPLRRARISVYGRVTFGRAQTALPAFTDAHGRFSIDVPATEILAVTAWKAGYETATVLVRRTAPQGPVEVRLRRAASISGRVTDDTGAPAVSQLVSARWLDAPPSPTNGGPPPPADLARDLLRSLFTATTDDRGEFRLGGLPPGRYELRPGVPSPGTVAGMLPRTAARPPDPVLAVSLVPGQEATADLVIGARATSASVTRRVFSIGSVGRLVAPATASEGRAVEGMIIDEYGEPMEGVSVQVLIARRVAGRSVATRFGPAHPTDDRGRYRIFGLPPGRYLVMASAAAEMTRAAGAIVGYAPVYYPGTPLIEFAAPLSLDQADASGVSFTLAPSPAARVTGSAFDSSGRPLSRSSVRLVARSGAGRIVLEALHASIDQNARFLFRDVPPGDYVVQASGERLWGGPAEFGIAHVTVADRDPPPVVVQTSPGVSLEGRVVVSGGEPLPPLGAAAVPLDPERIPVGTPEPAIVVSSAGTFYATGLSGRTAIALRRAPENWFIESIVIGGADVTDGAYDFGTGAGTIDGAEVVISPNGASISGRVTGDRAGPGRTIVVFPDAREQWTRHSRRTKAASLGGDGSFRVAGLPPGEYLVAVADGINTSLDEWQSGDVLEPLVATAVTVSVAEGETRVVVFR